MERFAKTICVIIFIGLLFFLILSGLYNLVIALPPDRPVVKEYRPTEITPAEQDHPYDCPEGAECKG